MVFFSIICIFDRSHNFEVYADNSTKTPTAQLDATGAAGLPHLRPQQRQDLLWADWHHPSWNPCVVWMLHGNVHVLVDMVPTIDKKVRRAWLIESQVY